MKKHKKGRHKYCYYHYISVIVISVGRAINKKEDGNAQTEVEPFRNSRRT